MSLLILVCIFLLGIILLLVKRGRKSMENFSRDKLLDSDKWIITLKDGLANRLRSIVGFKIISDYLGKPVQFVWKRETECDCNLQDIFDTTLVTIPNPNDDSRILTHSETAEAIIDNVIDDTVLSTKLKEKIPEYYKIYLQPKEELKNKCRKFISDNLASGFNAVHIRYRKEFTKGPKPNRQNYQDFDKFIADSVLPVFCATDSMEMKTQLSNKFGTKVIFYGEIRSENVYRASSIEDAIICICICSKAQKFKGTNFSSFSHLINIFNKIKVI